MMQCIAVELQANSDKGSFSFVFPCKLTLTNARQFSFHA